MSIYVQALKSFRIRPYHLTFSALLVALAAQPLVAEEVELGWENSAELSFIAADGNAETTTFGFSGTFLRRWQNRAWKTELSGLQADSTTTERTAVGTDDDFTILEVSTTERVAEKYNLKTRFDKDMTPTSFWFTGAGWTKDELAGIDTRLSAIAGFGKTFHDTESFRSAADVGLTFTHEQAVVDEVDDEDFLGLRLYWELFRQLTTTSQYSFELEINENLDDTSDLRADFANHLKVSMSERLALKLTLAFAYDNQPALTTVPLIRPDDSMGNVLAELDELDSVLKVALVFDF